jgi:hypothetical protein
LVNITTFKPKKHFEVLLDMHLAQGSKTYDILDLNTLPRIGYIVYSDTEYHYVAAGFLRMVEGGFAQIDTLVTNPNITGDVRNEGLTLLVDTLIKTAKDMELKGIYSMTTNGSIIDRALKLGFFVSNHVVIVLNTV